MNPALRWLLVAVVALLIWSGVHPHDYATWIFELAFGLAGVAALIATAPRFRFSNLAYLLAGIHFAILAAGAKYTYAEMPLFNWLRDALHLSRNHFDRVGHFAQGFVPAIFAREVFVRVAGVRRGGWLAFFVVCFCLAFSAFYELIEWWVVVLCYPHEGPAWLGMQGDPWDAHQDMLMALLGAISAVLLLSRAHDRSMARIGCPASADPPPKNATGVDAAS
ncbi:MAG TPA: DUF2238 domain-containing protein [Phycisphaerae bacterium]|nr:DUF2238 domain-containing protein [Phycisphaerales bacterium]HRX83568.1 DUF2238 domain-containing protein [Phycisphaerae bacterium]